MSDSDENHEESKSKMLKSQMSVYGAASTSELFGPSKGRRAARGRGRGRGTRPGAGARNWSNLPQYQAERDRLRRLAENGELTDEALMEALEQASKLGEKEHEASLLAQTAEPVIVNQAIRNGSVGAEDSGLRRRKRHSSRGSQLVGDLEVAVVLDELGLRAEERAVLWRVFLPLVFLALISVLIYVAKQSPSVISKGLGWMIILGTFAVKVPQIQSVREAESAEGLEMSRFYSESVSWAMIVAYHIAQRNPFTSWGDNLMLMGLNAVLISLLWKYMGFSETRVYAYTAGYGAIIAGSFGAAFGLKGSASGVIPMVSTVISQAGLIPQLFANHRNQHTGSLSLFSQGLSTMGIAVRIFTTLMEISDVVVLASFVTGFLLNAYLLYQIIHFRKNTAMFLENMKLVRTAQEAIPVE